ncbi:MAG: FkbM family methyltransferase [Candidatus Margulisiibacteriota bacterium]
MLERKVVILTQHFAPEVNATGQYMADLADHFARNGYPVLVIAQRSSREQPKWEEYAPGINLVRIKNSSFFQRNVLMRMLNSLTYFLRCFFRLGLIRRNDIVVLLSDPPFMPLLGWLLKKLKRVRLLYVIYDVYPDIAVKLGYLNSRGILAVGWDILHRQFIKTADVTVVIGRCMARVIRAKLRPGEGNVFLVPNWCDEKQLKPLPKEKSALTKGYNLQGKFVVLYSGNMGMAHPLERVIEAAARLRDNPDIVFLFCGEGRKKEKLMKLAAAHGLLNVLFRPFVPKEQLNEVYAAADVGLVVLDERATGLSVPSKLYALLAAGRPVLALADKRTETALVVSEAACGYVLDPQKKDDLADKIMALYNDPANKALLGEKARAYSVKRCAKQLSLERYLALLVKREKTPLARETMEAGLLWFKERGFYPATVIDVGAGSGTPPIIRTFPESYYIWLEPLAEYAVGREKLLSRYRGEYLNAAAGRSAGSQEIRVSADLVGSSLLFSKKADPQSLKTIDVIRLDSLKPQPGWREPILLKIDVQGFEMEVLAGATGILDRCEVAVIETSLYQFYPGNALISEVIARMVELGFVVFDLVGLSYRPYDNALGQVDVIFIKKDSPLRNSTRWTAPEMEELWPKKPS